MKTIEINHVEADRIMMLSSFQMRKLAIVDILDARADLLTKIEQLEKERDELLKDNKMLRNWIDPNRRQDDLCQKCGQLDKVWFAPNALWNKHHGRFNILCPSCFITLAEADGFEPTAWKLEPENL